MDKKKFLTASLASVAVLGSAFVVSQPSVVKAEGQSVASSQPAENKESAQKEFLANFDKAVEATVKELKEYLDNAKEDPELQKQIQGFIDEFEKRTKAQKADYEKRFEAGLTVEEAEKEVEGIAKEEEIAEEKEAKEEEDAQVAFLANFNKALKDTIAKLEESAKNNPEIKEQIQDTIAKLKAEAEKTRAKIEEGFKQGLTAEEAEKAIDDENKKLAEEAKAKAEEKAAQDEFLENYDKALEKAVAELEKADTKNDPELEKQKKETIAALKVASDETRKQIVEGFKKGLTAKQAEKFIDELNKKAAEEDKEAAAKEEAAQKEFLANYDAALKAAIAELEKAETNSPEEAKAKSDTIAALKAASDETRKQIVEGFKKGLTAKQAEKFIDELNKKAAEEDKAKEKPAEKPAEEPSQPAPAPAPKPEQPAQPSVPARPANPTYVPSYVPSYSSYSVVEPAKPASPKTGWKQENGMWYFYNTDGSMATGWVKDNGTWYYLNANGAMATGWLKDGDTWYYLEASGAMKVSQWFKVSDKWYYVDGSGALAVNTTVNGYTVNGNGEWV